MSLIRIENAWKSFGDLAVLKGVSLEVGEGEAHALARAFERQRAPDAAPRAGDHRHPSGELIHRYLRSLRLTARRTAGRLARR